MKYIILIISLLFFISCGDGLGTYKERYDKLLTFSDTNKFTYEGVGGYYRYDSEAAVLFFYTENHTLKRHTVGFYGEEIGTNPNFRRIFLLAERAKND